MTSFTKEAKSSLRIKFFESVFGANEGWLCISITDSKVPKAIFKQKFFAWPKDIKKTENYILSVEKKNNVYFCVNLLSAQERKKERCLPTNILWADLDEVNPDNLRIPPQVVISSSPDRFQAIWKLTTKLEPLQAENYCKRIAYSFGADKSGWDLTQLLRVPFTYNFKYKDSPMVLLVRALDTEAKPLLFEALPESEADRPDQPLPSLNDLPKAENIIYKYATQLRGTAFMALYSQEPSAEEDWSSLLWRLIHVLLEAGMSAEEVFSVAHSAPCNKYARDGRPIEHLWRDVLKADIAQKKIFIISGDLKPLIMPQLVEKPASGTFLDSYRSWAEEATDAVVAFHDLSCTILLSSIVANSVRLETSNVLLVPNLWGLILGDSTLTRKTTSMRMIIDFLIGLDPEMVMATDGSPEGLLSGLEQRPNRVSLFYKDEVSGFFDSINRKEYLAGMPETLTALYDVPPVFTRRLRKETIRIESPAFIFFGGGVPGKVYDALTDDYVLSGFLPRFLVVSGEASIDKLRRTGPPNEAGQAKRAAISEEIANIYENYATEAATHIGGQKVLMPQRIFASLTNAAWDKYGDIEEFMVSEASNSSVPDLALPTFERLSRSLLKMAIVLGCARQIPKAGKPVVINDKDIINAAWYIQDWGRFSVDLIMNAGKRASEKLLDKIIRVITEHPGILRSSIMQHYHLTKREADDVLMTLEDRQLVRREQQGRGWRYYIA